MKSMQQSFLKFLQKNSNVYQKKLFEKNLLDKELYQDKTI